MYMTGQAVKIPYGKERHQKLLDRLNLRRDMATRDLADWYDRCASAEDRFLAYVPLTELEKQREERKRDGEPQYVTIEIPLSLAMLLTAHTYWTNVFLGRSPIFQYQAMTGAAEMDANAIEAVIGYQTQIGEMLAPLYVWLMDAGKYGTGIVKSYWCEEYTTIARIEEAPVTLLGLPTGRTKKVNVFEDVPGYMGNRLYNVRPQDFFYDPRVSLSQFQSGEFCGRIVRNVGWNHIRRGESAGVYFNIEALKNNLVRSFSDVKGESQLKTPSETFPQDIATDEPDWIRSRIELVEYEVELAPSEWDLGNNDKPQKWLFTVANRAVIIGCQPSSEYHGRFSFDILEYEVEGYGLTKRSLLEIAQPLNDTLTWLFNSHMQNVRAAINNQLIVDPSRITMGDFDNPVGGLLLRLRPDAYGTDVRTVATQLPVADITQNHMNDARVVIDMLQRLLGVNDQVMGVMFGGGRRTATEVRQASGFGVNRLKTNCEYFSAQGFAPLSKKLLSRTQQYYTGEEWFKVAGDNMREGKRVMVTPDAIAGFYDYVPVDGTLPIDKFAMANLWKEMLMGVAKMGLAGQFDIPGIFSWVAQLAGLKNFDKFRIQVTPDQQLAAQAAAGNVIPLGGNNGQGQPRDPEAIPRTGSPSGVGPLS